MNFFTDPICGGTFEIETHGTIVSPGYVDFEKPINKSIKNGSSYYASTVTTAQ